MHTPKHKNIDPQIQAGNEISLAMLEIDAKTFATETDRQQATWTAYDEVRERFGLTSLMQVRMCKRVSERFANTPMMLHLFAFQELSAICALGVSDAQMRELADERRRNPSVSHHVRSRAWVRAPPARPARRHRRPRAHNTPILRTRRRMKRHLAEKPFAPAGHPSMRAAGRHFVARQKIRRVFRIEAPVAELPFERREQARQVRTFNEAVLRGDLVATRAEIADLDAGAFVHARRGFRTVRENDHRPVQHAIVMHVALQCRRRRAGTLRAAAPATHAARRARVRDATSPSA